jgi:hypothetical protein
MLGNSRVAAQLVASQEGLSSMELVKIYAKYYKEMFPQFIPYIPHRQTLRA